MTNGKEQFKLIMSKQIGNTKLYHISEVGKVINKSSRTVKRRIKAGDFDGQRIGNSWYIARDEFESIVEDLNWPVSWIDICLGEKPVKSAAAS